MNENMEFPGVSGEDIEWLQDSFVKAIKVKTVRFWAVGSCSLCLKDKVEEVKNDRYVPDEEKGKVSSSSQGTITTYNVKYKY